MSSRSNVFYVIEVPCSVFPCFYFCACARRIASTLVLARSSPSLPFYVPCFISLAWFIVITTTSLAHIPSLLQFLLSPLQLPLSMFIPLFSSHINIYFETPKLSTTQRRPRIYTSTLGIREEVKTQQQQQKKKKKEGKERCFYSGLLFYFIFLPPPTFPAFSFRPYLLFFLFPFPLLLSCVCVFFFLFLFFLSRF
uniref:Uncharacterized protein n=1 Tax=Trypanosoma vivax (strain Y486) TaxID=1055687 RepID=G0U425_TRYVY|nr:hypothetical protein TVY486_1012300 [Trypanosoma vivax Y486]